MIFDQKIKEDSLNALVQSVFDAHEAQEIDQMVVIVKKHNGQTFAAGHGDNLTLLGMVSIAEHTFLNSTPKSFSGSEQ